jgi:uncharacterized protein YjiS (DUF1127 family)
MSTMLPSAPCQSFAAAGRSAPSGLSRALIAVFDRLYDWQARAAERALLDSLDERQLRDIGLSRADISREVTKPFWQS